MVQPSRWNDLLLLQRGRLLTILLLLLLCHGSIAHNRMRYKEGLIDPTDTLLEDSTSVVLDAQRNLPMHQVRLHCQHHQDCVAFAVWAPTKVPAGPVPLAFFYRVAEWHVSDQTQQPVWMQDYQIELDEGLIEVPSGNTWHLYVNTTRESDAEHHHARITQELTKILRFLDQQAKTTTIIQNTESVSKLRGRDVPGAPMISPEQLQLEQRLIWLNALFNIALLHPLAAAPLLAQPCVDWATAPEESRSKNDPLSPLIIRELQVLLKQTALGILIVLADTPETAAPLVSIVYDPMKQLIQGRDVVLAKSALDVLSNIIVHRSGPANHHLRRLGVQKLLEPLLELPSIQGKPDFRSIQAAMALAHLYVHPTETQVDDKDDEEAIQAVSHLPLGSLSMLVGLLETALDGDVEYDIRWELVPGPLSAIYHIVSHDNLPTLLDAGLLDHVWRILDESTNATDLGVCLELLQKLHQLLLSSLHGHYAITMLWNGEHVIQEATERLAAYRKAHSTASQLLDTMRSHQGSRAEL